MRIYTRHREPGLRHGLASLLIASFDAPPGDVWVISPWMRDVELPLTGIGHYASIFGGHRDRAPLSELLARLAARHHLTLIVKPPGELVPLREVRRLLTLLKTRTEILEEEGIRDYNVVDRTVQALNVEVRALAASAVKHAETLRMAWRLQEQGAELFFLDRLHAKLLCTPAGALLGSANFTYGGFGANEELMVEVTTPKEHQSIQKTAREFTKRATSASLYDLTPELRRAGIPASEFHTWIDTLAAAGQGPVCDLLRPLLPLVR